MRAPKMIFPPVLAPIMMLPLRSSENKIGGAKTGGKIIFGARMSTASRCQTAASGYFNFLYHIQHGTF